MGASWCPKIFVSKVLNHHTLTHTTPLYITCHHEGQGLFRKIGSFFIRLLGRKYILRCSKTWQWKKKNNIKEYLYNHNLYQRLYPFHHKDLINRLSCCEGGEHVASEAEAALDFIQVDQWWSVSDTFNQCNAERWGWPGGITWVKKKAVWRFLVLHIDLKFLDFIIKKMFFFSRHSGARAVWIAALLMYVSMMKVSMVWGSLVTDGQTSVFYY